MTPLEQALLLVDRFLDLEVTRQQAIDAAKIAADTVAQSMKGLTGQWLFWVSVKNELEIMK